MDFTRKNGEWDVSIPLRPKLSLSLSLSLSPCLAQKKPSPNALSPSAGQKTSKMRHETTPIPTHLRLVRF
ncbi:predicted protein [Plenodomus lingam JN3]|uniref:Predicted protein n=1 Tax=Leptosphaeria maculans (strain JN3 / isolate v23.1.3 / race Av1-4-5-6-7-8) TaxID=985895 RepID=E5A866_LEPMJ|nr:predicted protein [Plenodomus lingam JN3]CBX99811.1 predicted protein [Plenodomus lingam JN3]